MAQGFQSLASLLGQLGQQAPSIFNSLNAGQTASNPYLQNYNKTQQQPMQQQSQMLGGFMPQQTDEIPTESFIPYQQQGGFNINSLFNRNRQISGGQEVNPFNNIILG